MGKGFPLSVYRKSAGRRLLKKAGVSGRFVKHGFVDCMVACKLAGCLWGIPHSVHTTPPSS